MYRYVAIFVVALGVGFLTGWKTQGWRSGKEIATIQANHAKTLEKIQEAADEAEREYRGKEQSLITAAAKAQEKRNVEVADINRRYTTLVRSMRNRPERANSNSNGEMPGATPACIGTTGAELARGDAEFLAGYAADAAKLESELNKCEAAYNALRN